MTSVYVVTDAPDALFERATAAGAEVIQGLKDEGYGSRGQIDLMRYLTRPSPRSATLCLIMTGTLFVLGIALLAAAFIGGGLKVSNIVEIPVISTRLGGFGLALVGMIAIALGYQFHYWSIRPDQESTPAAIASPPMVDNPAASSALPTSTAGSPPVFPDPRIFYTGIVRLNSSGLDFDLAPPRRVNGFNIEYLGSGLLYSMSNIRMTQWDQQESPDKAACTQYVDKRESNQVSGLTDGAIVCFRTDHGHIGRLDVQSAGSDVLTVYATVWKN